MRTKTIEDFQNRLDELTRLQEDSGDESPRGVGFDINEKREGCLQDGYKGRDVVDGCLLHYAIEQDSKTGAQERQFNATELVLRFRADPECQASYKAENMRGIFMPIHLAAGLGCEDLIELLVEYRADVNKKSLRESNGVRTEHYIALHEACFMNRVAAVEMLIKNRADTNARNRVGETPLHIVAKNGAAKIAKMLVDAGARLDVRIKDSSPKPASAAHPLEAQEGTPLEVAITGARTYPVDDLHILAPFLRPDNPSQFLSGVSHICKLNMPAARSLVRSFRQECEDNCERFDWLFAQMQDQADNESPIAQIADIFRFAPEVGLDILDMMFVKPKVKKPAYHPLPVMADFSDKHSWLHVMVSLFTTWTPQSAHTKYVDSCVWDIDPTSNREPPPWHMEFAPYPRGPQGSLLDYEVDIKVMRVPNVLDTRIVHAINHTCTCLDLLPKAKVFSTPVVMALVGGAWKYVSRAVYLDLSIAILITSTMTYWAVTQTDLVQFSQSNGRLFSIIGGLAARELFDFFLTLASHRRFGFDFRNFLTGDKLMEFLMSTLLLVLFWLTRVLQSNQVNMVLCINLLARWMRLSHNLRLLTGVGDKILAFAHSVFPMKEFFVFAGLNFAAFFSAFAALLGQPTTADGDTITLEGLLHDLFFFVLASDGKSFEDLESLVQNQGLLVFALVGGAVIVLSLSILNLMISISGNMYTAYEERSGVLFIHERSKAVEEYLLRFSWSRFWRRVGPEGHWCSNPYIPLILAGFLCVVWIISVLPPAPNSCISALFIMGAVELVQSSFLGTDVFDNDQRVRLQRQDPNYGYQYLQAQRMENDTASGDAIPATRHLLGRTAIQEEAAWMNPVAQPLLYFWECRRRVDDSRAASNAATLEARAASATSVSLCRRPVDTEILERMDRLERRFDTLLKKLETVGTRPLPRGNTMALPRLGSEPPTPGARTGKCSSAER